MKKLLVVGLLFMQVPLFAQDYKSGDVEIDASLKIVNTEANKDLNAFKSDLVKTFSVTMPKVELCFKAGMNAGDAYIAFELSNLSRRPIEEVIKSYKTNKTKGWGVIAKELGIKPGSDAFHKLKNDCKGKSNGKGNSSKAKSYGNGNSGKGKGNSGKSNGKGKAKS